MVNKSLKLNITKIINLYNVTDKVELPCLASSEQFRGGEPRAESNCGTFFSFNVSQVALFK